MTARHDNVVTNYVHIPLIPVALMEAFVEVQITVFARVAHAAASTRGQVTIVNVLQTQLVVRHHPMMMFALDTGNATADDVLVTNPSSDHSAKRRMGNNRHYARRTRIVFDVQYMR